MRNTLTLIAALGALLTQDDCNGGRLEHELIQVNEDGSVTYEVALPDTSKTEMQNGTPWPTPAGVWAISWDSTGRKMTATATFAKGDSLPVNFADPDDPFAHRYLQFPTTVTVDERDHGTYYHFRRKYKEPPWSPALHIFVDFMVRFNDYPDRLERMTPEQLSRLVNALLEIPRRQREILARLAFEDATPEDAAEVWEPLLVRLEAITDERAEARLMERAMADSNDDEPWSDYVRALQQLEETVIRETLARQPTITPDAIDTMIDRLRWYNRRVIPGSLEELVIKVDLPGTIIVTNAPYVDGNRVTWPQDRSFVGPAYRELLATSFVAK